ncbi:MAG: ribonuclease Z [Candidatus Omnitrophica bacterium]|nr:ribonuclease Z [Candidatus Omnitrophota bacterium]
MKIIFLGTAASISTKERDNTSLLLCKSRSRELILIDCPGSLVSKFKKLNLNYTKLNKVIITHHHPDHIYGLVSLIHSQYKLNKKLTIFSSNFSIRIIKKFLGLFNLTSKNYPKISFIDVFSQKYFFKNSDLKISAFKNKHCKGSFGINIIYKNKNIVYSSDTALTKNIEKLINKNTYLIHDCTASSKFFKKHLSLYNLHTEAKQLKALAFRTKPKLLIPIHFLLLRKNEFKNIKKDLKEVKNIFLPEDFSSLYIR